MNQEETNMQYIEEDSIDLRELWATLMKRKMLVIIMTGLITFLAVVYVLVKQPIYGVKSNIEVGYIGDKLVNETGVLIKILKIVFNVEDKIESKDEFVSEVVSVSGHKKLKNFIEVKSEGISKEEALKKNQEVLAYLQAQHQAEINQYISNIKYNIETTRREIKNIDSFEIKNIQEQIKRLKTQKIAQIDEKIKKLKEQDISKLQKKISLLKTQKIVQIDEKIKKLKEQDIPKLQKKISLLKTQKIVQIDEKIKFLKEVKLETIQSKIDFHTEKLKEYTDAVNKLYKESKSSSDATAVTVASMQMVNYQNLILNSQNKIEDLKIEKETILTETIISLQRDKENIQEVSIRDLQLEIDNINNITIVHLQREKENIQGVSIRDLQLEIDNINNITIVNLQREKENISNESIRKLQHKIDVEFVNKKIELNKKISQFIFNMSELNVQNSKLIGEYIIKDYPVKPKKKLVVVVAFITGLMLSIFIAFFLEFIQTGRKNEAEA